MIKSYKPCQLFLLVIFIVSIPRQINAQDKFIIDSLTVALNNTKNDSLKSRLYTELSRQYFANDLLTSLKYIDEALSTAIETEDEVLILKMYRAKGGILTYMGIYDDAIDNFLDGLSLAEKNSMQSEVAMLLNNIGAIYIEIKKNEEALEYLFKALEVYKTMPDDMQQMHRRRLGAIYNNIGNIYLEKEDFETTLTYYQRGLELATSANDEKLKSVALKNLAEVHRVDGRYEESLQYCSQAMAQIEERKDMDELAKLHNLYAAIYIDLGQYNLALKNAELAKETALSIGANQTLERALEKIYISNKALNNPGAALAAHEEYKAINDTLVNENTVSKITQAQLQFEYEKTESERQSQLQKARLLTVFITAILLLALIILALLFFLARIKSRQTQLQNEKLAQNLELKNKELTTNVMYLVRKNELINNVAKRLIQLKDNMMKENQKPVQDIVYELNSEVDQDIWQEFEFRFQQVHTRFYDKLREKHPDLSPAEERLCAFLRLNLSSKEIAAITHQSPKGIDVSRARLRKKLNLTNTEANLVSYLAKL